MNCMNCGAVVQNTDVCQECGFDGEIQVVTDEEGKLVFRESPFSYLSCITIRGWKKRKSGTYPGQ